VGRLLGGCLLALSLTVSAAGAALADDAPASTAPTTGTLTLVTLQGAGTAGGSKDAAELLARQDALLAAIGAGEPVYRWTTALNGFAVRLTDDQVSVLDGQPGIAAIEADRVRPLAGRTTMASVHGAATNPRLRGGAGVVIGVVDSGIAPESPAFAEVPGLGREPRDFAGVCAQGEDWSAEDCTRGGSWTGSAPTGSAPRSRCRHVTSSGTAPRSRRSRPATPG
jgi:hypothetical protein